MSLITSIGNQEPLGPVAWQDAAAASVVQIFRNIEPCLEYSSGNALSEEMIKIQFEGMHMNSQGFDSDAMYWSEEWKILGTIAAAAGIKNQAFFEVANAFFGLGENEKNHRQPARSEFYEFSAGYSYPVFSVDPKINKSMQALAARIVDTLCRKQHDYGHENIARFGRLGLLVRVHDKIARLNNMVKRGGAPQNESIEDTYTDIVGYSAIGMMVERGWFSLELRK